MNTPFLETKLYLPIPRSNNLARPGLTHFLSQNLDGGKRFFLISAAAGHGKTTLISQWLQQIPNPTAWVTLDENDNQLSRFWSYVSRALQGIDPSLANSMLESLQSNQGLVALNQVMNDLDALANELANLPGKTLLVLDDYHLIDNPSIHESLSYWVEHAPPSLILVMTTRVDPPLPLSRWRSRGLLAEVRTSHLQFNQKETAQFLQSTINLELPPSLLNLLHKRTEVWVAALQMLALALQQPGESTPQDTSIFLQRLASNQHYIIDYLFDEVIKKEDLNVQQFLLDTSILEPLSAELCSQVVADLSLQQAQHMLEQLSSANLFIEPIDPDRRWFHYHHLFSEILQSRLRRDSLERFHQLHMRASDGCQALNLSDLAIEHARISENSALLVKRVFENAPEALKQSNVGQCRRWLELLPESVLASSLDGCILYAWALFLNHDLPATVAWLPKIEAALSKTRNTPAADILRGEYLAILATVKINQKQYAESIRLCEEALQLNSLLYVSGIVRHTLAYAHFYRRDYSRAVESFEKSIADSFAAGNLIPATSAVKGLVDAAIRLGALPQAEVVCRQSLALFRDSKEDRAPLSLIQPSVTKKFPRRAAGMILIALGDIAFLKNDTPSALSHYQEAVGLLSIGGYLPLSAYAHLGLARLQHSRGETDQANQSLHTALDLIQKGITITFCDEVEREMARQGLSNGDPAPAEAWAKKMGLDRDPVFSDLFSDQDWIVYAQLLASRGRFIETFTLLDQVIAWGQTHSSMGVVMEGLTQKTILLAQNGQLQAARQTLDDCLQIPGWQSYAAWVIAAQNSLTLSPPRQPGPSKPAEPVSPREVEILQLLAEGCTNQEIAERYFISIHTVKTHIKHIFTKLDVENRSQAVHSARQLKIIL